MGGLSEPERERIVSLQILRFVAAAMVICSHLIPRMGGSFDVGAAGVDVFFVLSGFVITLTGPLATKRPTCVAFFWRRWCRVAPIYYLLSAPLIVAAGVGGLLTLPRLVDTFLFWPAAGAKISVPYLVSGWTLGFEMIFYSAVSLLLLGDRVRRNLVILAGVVLSLAAARLVVAWNPLGILVNPIFLEFGAGSVLALVRARIRATPLWTGLLMIGASLGAFIAQATVGTVSIELDPIFSGNTFARVVAFGVPAVLLVSGMIVVDRAIGHGRAVRVGAWLGDASYSTYLTQNTAVPVLAAFAAGAGLVVQMSIFAVCLGVGALTYVLIEQPILRDLKRLRPIHWPWRTVPVAQTPT